MKSKRTNGCTGSQFKSISKECGGGFLVALWRDEVEVNNLGSWECRSLQVVTWQWATFSCPRLRQARS